MEQYIQRAKANFPFPYEIVPGRDALKRWQEIDAAKKGAPIVIGDEEAFGLILDSFSSTSGSSSHQKEPTVADTLAKAGRLVHPASMTEFRQKEKEKLDQYLASHPAARKQLDSVPVVRGQADIEKLLKSSPGSGKKSYVIELIGPGADPSEPANPSTTAPTPFEPPDVQKSLSTLTPPTVAWDLLKGTYFDNVYIVTLPTNDWTTAPAYLRWGGWNACPPPEYHVAAFRSWRDRYGAELVGMSSDTLNIKVVSRPAHREEAQSLAREQYEYCPDIVDQGTGSVEVLAEGLLSSDWWGFWWD